MLIGTTNEGAPCVPIGTFDLSVFDAANLNNKVRKYTHRDAHLVSQIHDHEGSEIVLIYIPASPSALPVPMAADGQYEDPNGKQKHVFRVGDLPVRGTAQNEPLRYEHWEELLARHDEGIRDETRRNIDALITRLAALQGSGGSQLLPLDEELDEAPFVQIVSTHLETPGVIRLKTFLYAAADRATHTTGNDIKPLDHITIVVAQAMFHGREDIVEMGIERLEYIYSQTEFNKPRRRLDIVDRVYALGSCAVRLKLWTTVQRLSLGKATRDDYPSWIREGQVDASNAQLFPQDKGGLMISTARLMIVEHPGMRPDLSEVYPPDTLNQDDALLNSLCRFDVLYCIVVEVRRKPSQAEGYPASSAFNQIRINPILSMLVQDADVRTELAPGTDDSKWAAGIRKTVDLARRESFSYGGDWSGYPHEVYDFFTAHPV
nr:ATP-binding protein [Rhodococcus sp. 06-621-2]